MGIICSEIDFSVRRWRWRAGGAGGGCVSYVCDA
jgi:hypothetical protein